MKLIIFIITFCIGIFIAEYNLDSKTISTKAVIVILNDNTIKYKQPIGRTLTRLGIGLEDSSQVFNVSVEYVINKQIIFENLNIPATVLQKRITSSVLPIKISILYFPFISGDFISILRIDGQILKKNYFFKTNYRGLL